MYAAWAGERGMKLRELPATDGHLLFAVAGLGAGAILRDEAGLHVCELVTSGDDEPHVERIAVSVEVGEIPAAEPVGDAELARRIAAGLDDAAFPGQVTRRYQPGPSPLVRDAVRGTGRAGSTASSQAGSTSSSRRPSPTVSPARAGPARRACASCPSSSLRLGSPLVERLHHGAERGHLFEQRPLRDDDVLFVRRRLRVEPAGEIVHPRRDLLGRPAELLGVPGTQTLQLVDPRRERPCLELQRRSCALGTRHALVDGADAARRAPGAEPPRRPRGPARRSASSASFDPTVASIAFSRRSSASRPSSSVATTPCLSSTHSSRFSSRDSALAIRVAVVTRIGLAKRVELVEPLLERGDTEIEPGEAADELLDVGEPLLQVGDVLLPPHEARTAGRRALDRAEPLLGRAQPLLELGDRRVIPRSEVHRGVAAAPTATGRWQQEPVRLPVLGERAREVETREAALRDEDLADPAALLALDLERRLELRARDETELDEDLADGTPAVGGRLPVGWLCGRVQV